MADPDAGNARLVPQHLIQFVVPFDGNVAPLGLFNQLVGEDLFGAELVTAMDDGDMAGDVGEVKRLLHGRAAAADDGDRLAAVEKAVAGGAGRNALALEGLFGGKPQVFGRGAGGYDQSIAAVGAASPCRRRGADFRSAG